MGKYNFDEVIDRHGTDCLKYERKAGGRPPALGGRHGFPSAG